MKRKHAANPGWELDPNRLRAAMVRRTERSTEIQCDLAFSAIPALFEHYASRCEALFELAARPLSGNQRAQLRALLSQALKTGFEASAHAKVLVRVRSDPTPAQTASDEIRASKPARLRTCTQPGCASPIRPTSAGIPMPRCSMWLASCSRRCEYSTLGRALVATRCLWPSLASTSMRSS